jgi:hypothetical protein
MATCYYHGDRPGVGVCVRCRVVICAACRTRVEDRNHCHACLKILGRRGEDVRPAAAPGAWLAGLILSLGWVFLLACFWLVQGKLAP